MQPVENSSALEKLVQQAPIVVVEIGSVRCCACSAIAGKLSAYCAGKDDLAYASLSLEAAADTCADLGIYSAPAVLVFVHGRLTIREAGVMSIEAIIQRIERYRALMKEDA